MNDPKYSTLLGWLRAKPALSGIRCDGDDKRIVRIVARAYGTAERTLLSMRANELEGLDGSGAVIRTWTLHDAVTELTAAPVAAKPAPRIDQWPAGATSELAHAISIACDRSAERHENAYRYSFDTLVGLYKDQSARLQRLEENMTNTAQARIAEAEAYAQQMALEAEELRAELAKREEQPKNPGQTDAGDQLVGALIGGVVKNVLTQGETHGPATNGAAKSS
jgi:hypothetical protein